MPSSNAGEQFAAIRDLFATFEATSDAITEAIDEMLAQRRAEIEALEGALGALRSDAPASTGTTDKPAGKSSSRKTSAAKSGTSSRKARVKSGSKSSSKSSDEPSRKDLIAGMLNDGKSPKEIADELGIKPNYVYHVKRSLEQS
jgi:DNA-binding NarL/FixJ family response regulator